MTSNEGFRRPLRPPAGLSRAPAAVRAVPKTQQPASGGSPTPAPANKAIPEPDHVFLEGALAGRRPVIVELTDGTQLGGEVVCFSLSSIYLKVDGTDRVIYKRAITQIYPARAAERPTVKAEP